MLSRDGQDGMVQDGSAQPRPPLSQRKRPVHMPPVERHNASIILFVTLAIQPRGPWLANTPFRDALVAACGDADAWSVGFHLIMPDHVHLFCRPARSPAIGIKRWSVYLKERITKRPRQKPSDIGSAKSPPIQSRPMEGEAVLSRNAQTGVLADGSTQSRPPVAPSDSMEATPSRLPWKWQPNCWDTQMRNSEHYHDKWEYVRQNPVRKELVSTPDDWPWQGVLNVLEW